MQDNNRDDKRGFGGLEGISKRASFIGSIVTYINQSRPEYSCIMPDINPFWGKVDDVLERVGNSIPQGTDAIIETFAEEIKDIIYNSDDIEEAASRVVNRLAEKHKRAVLRVKGGIKASESEKERDNYKRLLILILEEIKALPIAEYKDAVLLDGLKCPEPQQKHPMQHPKSLPARGKGRPKETLKDKMINDTDGSKLQKVHTVMDGKKGKDAALIVLVCIKKGWMSKPTFTQVAEEFGDIGTRQGFTKYLTENRFTKDEIEGVMNSLD